jgi:hypothetical protein
MLLGHLAQFGSLFSQGELLCTQGLAYLLRDRDARDALGDHVESIGVPRKLNSDLDWRAEAVQPDGGRPDLEAWTSRGELVAKIEAKLDAHLDPSQILSYFAHLRQHAPNGVLLVVIISLMRAHAPSGEQLVFLSLIVWMTNSITFGLWFWSIDRGGPLGRLEPNPPPPDFLFPQVSDASLATSDWQPRLFDYMYLSFTNSIAFSPTDTLPLTHLAKFLMLSEAQVSAFTILLVVARAVNILA